MPIPSIEGGTPPLKQTNNMLASNFNLLHELLCWQKDEVMTDTLLVGRDGRVAAHSLVLAASSDFWKRILTFSQYEEGFTILLPDHDSSELKTIIKQLYQLEDGQCVKTEVDIDKKLDDESSTYCEVDTHDENFIAAVRTEEDKDKILRCGMCLKTFSQVGNLNTHMKIHVPNREKTFKCRDCSKAYYMKEHLDRHYTSAHPIAKFICVECSECFDDNKTLKAHKKNYHPKCEKDYLCDQCSKSFSSKGALNVHLEQIHAEAEHLCCTDCTKAFSSKKKLKEHILRAHIRNNSFQCDQCPYSCYSKEYLKIHTRQHTGERPYKCEHCPKSFSQNSHLISHINTHTGIKSFPCDVCLKSFRDYSNMRNHRKKHDGTKTHRCEICTKAFFEAGNLKQHMRIHTGEKPYSCTTCKSAFSQAHQLKSHLQHTQHNGDELVNELI